MRYRYPYAELFAHARREKAKRLALEGTTPPAGPSPIRGSVNMTARCSACGHYLWRSGFRGPWIHAVNHSLTTCQEPTKEDQS